MTTTHNPDGTVSRGGIRVEHSQTDQGPLLVTVTAAGHHRLSELRNHAALAFATILERAVDWPALVRTTELPGDSFAAVYELVS